MTTFEQVKAVLVEELGIDERDITPKTSLDSLNLDSLEFIELLLALREKVGDIPDEAAQQLNTVGDIVRELE